MLLVKKITNNCCVNTTMVFINIRFALYIFDWIWKFYE